MPLLKKTNDLLKKETLGQCNLALLSFSLLIYVNKHVTKDLPKTKRDMGYGIMMQKNGIYIL